MRPYGPPQQLESRRRRAVSMLCAGNAYRVVAQKLKASLSSVIRWHQLYRKNGRKGLRPKLTPGRPCRLTRAQKRTLSHLLLKGAVVQGYSTDLWTVKRLVRLIGKHFGIRYGWGGARRLLAEDLGWSYQKPQRRATQRNEKAIEQWKKDPWPRIKKRSKTWSPPRFPRRERVLAHSQCA